jgi:hypothetical protein
LSPGCCASPPTHSPTAGKDLPAIQS